MQTTETNGKSCHDKLSFCVGTICNLQQKIISRKEEGEEDCKKVLEQAMVRFWHATKSTHVVSFVEIVREIAAQDS